jgi:hypothetical protein
MAAKMDLLIETQITSLPGIMRDTVYIVITLRETSYNFIDNTLEA